jgi:hypothetical protein
MDEDWDWDPDHIVDLDVTGDPQLDQFCYQSPRREFTPPPSQSFDYLAQYRRDQEQRDQRREEARRRRESPPSQSVAPIVRGGCYPQAMGQVMRPPRGGNEGWPVAPPVTPSPSGPLPGQHGAYFEVRTKRVWWAPWRKKRMWQQDQRLAHGTAASGRDGRHGAGRGGAAGSSPHHRPRQWYGSRRVLESPSP